MFLGLSREGIKSDDIEDGHKTDSHISEIPDEGVGGDAPDKEHDQSQNFIKGLPAPFVPEKVGHVASRIEKDAEERGKAEEE